MQATIGGVAIAYTIDGKDGAPFLTMSNSLATDHHMWDEQVSALADRFRILRYDVRGHGATPPTAGAYTMDALAEDARRLMREMGIETTHFIGLSMGGMVGQTLALKYPGLIRSLVLADTSSDLSPMEAMWNDRIETAGTDGMEPIADALMPRWFTEAFLAAPNPVTAQVRDMITATTAAGFIGCCHALRDFNLADRISAITVPTNIIVGEKDSLIEPSRYMNAQINGSQLDVLTGAAHLSNMEQVAAFNGVLTRFYDAL
ncbi:MAG: alpha/beta fold hydrolase [Alphaproteobacteria bacterium]